MQVVVGLKEAAAVDDAFEIRDNAIPEEFLEFEMNEWDEYALETAVQLVEDGVADEVITVTIGPERCEESIRKALAKGADRSIRVWDETLAELDFLDVDTKASILARVIEDLSPELVLTGVQSGDDMFGATGVQLGHQLNYAWAAVVNQLKVEDDRLVVHRELEGGVEERTELDIPAVCTIQTGINEPRYASLRGIRMAQRAEIEVRNLEDLGLDISVLDSPIRLDTMRIPTVESAAQILDGSASETAEKLADILHEQGVRS